MYTIFMHCDLVFDFFIILYGGVNQRLLDSRKGVLRMAQHASAVNIFFSGSVGFLR